MLLTTRKSNQLPNMFDDVINHNWDEFWKPVRYNGSADPAVNIYGTENQYVIELAVPGANKSDFKIEVNNGMLTISSDIKEADTANNQHYTRREFRRKAFSKSFELPKGKTMDDKIEAKYENGILEVIIPKHEDAKLKPTREIKVV